MNIPKIIVIIIEKLKSTLDTGSQNDVKRQGPDSHIFES